MRDAARDQRAPDRLCNRRAEARAFRFRQNLRHHILDARIVMHDVAILFDLGGAFDIALPLCQQADQRAIQAIDLRPQSRHIGTGGGRKGWGFGHGGLA